MRTNASHLYLPSTDYLIAFRERGIFRFHPETTVNLPQPIPGPKAKCIQGKVQTRLRQPADLPFWPDTDDTCLISPSDQPTEFVGLGFNIMTIPDCLSLEESACIVWNSRLLDRHSLQTQCSRQALQTTSYSTPLHSQQSRGDDWIILMIRIFTLSTSCCSRTVLYCSLLCIQIHLLNHVVSVLYILVHCT